MLLMLDQSFITSLGYTPEEFYLLTKMTSWATCAQPDDLDQDWTTLDTETKRETGWQCKRILDMGRILYLRDKGFQCDLKYYVDKDISLENILLKARKIENN